MKVFYEDVPLSEFTVVAGKSYEAAVFLAEYLGCAMGVKPEVDEASISGRREIRVGVANSNVNRRLRFTGIKNGGFIVKFALGNILIRADSVLGEMNGVIEFLERYAGWRFYPGKDVCAGSGEVILRERGGFSFTPAFAVRGIYMDECGSWMERNHLNYGPRELVKVDFSGGVDAAAEKICGVLDYNPGCTVVEAECPAGEVSVGFMNRVGDVIRDDYPGVWLELRVNPGEALLPGDVTRDNVGVKLVIEQGGLKDISDWAKVTSRVEVEYVVEHDVDYHAAAGDFRFFAENNVYGVTVKFCGTPDRAAAYILARLMWNPFLSAGEIDALAGEAGKLG